MYQANKKTKKKKKKTFVIDRDIESENETLSAGEGFYICVRCNYWMW